MRRTQLVWILLSGFVACFLVGCGDQSGDMNGPPPTSITVTTATTQQVEHLERSVGRLVANTAPNVAAETSGRVTEVYAEAGDSVEMGQVLARLDDQAQTANQGIARGEVERLQALLSQQSARVNRLNTLVVQSLVSEDQYDEAMAQQRALESQLSSAQSHLKAATLDLEHTEILAPVSGVIESRLVSEGDFVARGQLAFSMVSAEALRAVLPLPQRLSEVIQVGQMTRLKSIQASAVEIEGPISEIRPVVGAQSRAIEVVVEVTNPGHWRDGQSVVGDIVLDAYEGVVVPPRAVVRRPIGEVVYVLENNGTRVREQAVQVSLRTHSYWVIASGLAPGEKIALDGAGFLTDGATVLMGQQTDAGADAL